MRINTTVVAKELSILATFTEEDFPKRELLEETEWVKIPDSYRGSSDDPYLAAAFNSAIKASLSNVLYNDSVISSADSQHASPSISQIIFSRFNIPSKIFNNLNHAHMETMNRSKPFGTTDLQFYYYIIAEFLAQVTYSGGFLQDSHYSYYELHERIYHFFFLPLKKDESVTELPARERWATYKLLLESTAGFSYNNIATIIEANYMKLWELSEKVSLKEAEAFNKAFMKTRNGQSYSVKVTLSLLENFTEDPKTVIDILNTAPETWLKKILGENS